MILTCENCHTRYLVPNGAIGPEGREVRCASCHHQWFQDPEDTPSAPVEEVMSIPDSIKPVPEGSSVPALRETAAGGGRDAARTAGYLAAGIIFLLILTGLVTQRTKIVHAWLPSIRLYEALGIAPVLPGEGLALDNIKAAVTTDDKGVKVLAVTGTIINMQDKTVVIPSLQASILLDDGRVFYGWKIDPPQPDIGAHGQTEFKTSYPVVPENAKEAKVDLLLTH